MATYQEAYAVYKKYMKQLLSLSGVVLVTVECRNVEQTDCFILVQLEEGSPAQVPLMLDGVPVITQYVPKRPKVV